VAEAAQYATSLPSLPRNDPIMDHLVSRRFDFRIILVSLDTLREDHV
jgi:hypothetical protein